MTDFSELVATTVKLHAAEMAIDVKNETALMAMWRAWGNRNRASRFGVLFAYDAGAEWAKGLRHDARA